MKAFTIYNKAMKQSTYFRDIMFYIFDELVKLEYLTDTELNRGTLIGRLQTRDTDYFTTDTNKQYALAFIYEYSHGEIK